MTAARRAVIPPHPISVLLDSKRASCTPRGWGRGAGSTGGGASAAPAAAQQRSTPTARPGRMAAPTHVALPASAQAPTALGAGPGVGGGGLMFQGWGVVLLQSVWTLCVWNLGLGLPIC